MDTKVVKGAKQVTINNNTVSIGDKVSVAGRVSVDNIVVVQGGTADDTTVSAAPNPIGIGARFQSSVDTIDDGDIGLLSSDSKRQLRVVISDFNHAQSGNVGAMVGSAGDNQATSLNGVFVRSALSLYDGTNLDLFRAVTSTNNSDGTGIAAVGLVAQFDDTSPQTVTENQFGNVRMSSRGMLYTKQGRFTATPSYSFTRPTDVVQYAAGDIVANSTVAGTVIPLSWAVARDTGESVRITRARVRKTGQSITASSFRVHIFSTAAGVSVSTGDNTVFASVASPMSKYVGYIDVVVDQTFKDGAVGSGFVSGGSGSYAIDLPAGAVSISGILAATGTYTPLSAEVFTVQLEVEQD